MRISFLLPQIGQEGGVRVVATYARLLAERGHAVHAYSLGRERKIAPRRRMKDLAKFVARGDWAMARDTIRRPLLVRKTHFDDTPELHTKLPHNGPITDRDLPDADVVVASWWETAEWARKLSPSKGRIVHLIQHDERRLAHDPAMARRIGEVTWNTPGVTRVCVSDWLAGIGKTDFGVASTVVENAVDHIIFDAPPREKNKRLTVGL
ncbi:MAG: hypothetical protein AAGK78_09010, partial [Planctomycetota bacterium]